jgi:hypothetical protein
MPEYLTSPLTECNRIRLIFTVLFEKYIGPNATGLTVVTSVLYSFICLLAGIA